MGTIPITTAGTSISPALDRCCEVRGISPNAKSPLPCVMAARPSPAPLATYLIWTFGLCWLYALAHLLTSGAGTVEPEPTSTIASWQFPIDAQGISRRAVPRLLRKSHLICCHATVRLGFVKYHIRNAQRDCRSLLLFCQ